jgi:hypothetical protein
MLQNVVENVTDPGFKRPGDLGKEPVLIRDFHLGVLRPDDVKRNAGERKAQGTDPDELALGGKSSFFGEGPRGTCVHPPGFSPSLPPHIYH